MPFRDGTGPRGQGPLTGRGLGYCSGDHARPSFGGGRGYRNWYRAAGLTGWQRANASSQGEDAQSQIDSLRVQVRELEETIKSLKKKK